MKKFAAILSLVFISSSAFALHPNGEDTCHALTINGKTLEMVLENSRATSPHKIIEDSLSAEENLYVEFRGATLGSNDDFKSGALKADLILQTSKKGDENLKRRNIDDGCFEGFEQTSTRQVTIVEVSKKVSDLFEISKGSVLNLVCYTAYSAPRGKKCF